jgi:hypothetical protein
LLWFVAKRQFQSFIGAKEIGGDGKLGTFNPGEQQGRTTCRDNAPVNLGDFQIGIDFLIDNEQLIFFFEYVQVTAQVVEFRNTHGLLLVIVVMMGVAKKYAMILTLVEMLS